MEIHKRMEMNLKVRNDQESCAEVLVVTQPTNFVHYPQY